MSKFGVALDVIQNKDKAMERLERFLKQEICYIDSKVKT